MANTCEICGKKSQFGNCISHAHNVNKKVRKPNVQKIRIRSENGSVKRAYVCTRCIRSGKVSKAV
ncbi:MAG: 50S ribosomal protein L28 [bacterium]